MAEVIAILFWMHTQQAKLPWLSKSPPSKHASNSQISAQETLHSAQASAMRARLSTLPDGTGRPDSLRLIENRKEAHEGIRQDKG